MPGKWCAAWALAALLVGPTVAKSEIPPDGGRGYPLCRAVIAALRRLPPGTPAHGWADKLPSIRGVTTPVWTPLDPASNTAMIRSLMVNAYRTPGTTSSDEEIWSRVGPAFDDALASGRMRLEETTLTGVRVAAGPARLLRRLAYLPNGAVAVLGSEPGVPKETVRVTDIHLVRYGVTTERREGRSLGDLRIKPFVLWHRESAVNWSYAATSFSAFPSVHDYPIGIGSLDLARLVLVQGQPWLINPPNISILVMLDPTSDLLSSYVHSRWLEDRKVWVEDVCSIQQ